MANIIESRVTLEDEVFEETIDTAEEPIEVVRPTSYNDLQDLPQINGVTLQGNKTSSDLGIVTQNDINSAVSAEATLRENADTALGGRIDQEITDRGNADTALGGRIDGEIMNRTNADNALGTRIDNEILARQGGDNNLQSQIDAITSKSDVVDVVATYADLQAYDTQHLGNNDVIKVLDDETHDDAQTYYRWNKTAGTWSYIGSEAPYYSKGQMDTMLQAKQDKIDATHKLSADLVTDTSTTNKFVTAEDKTAWNAKQNALTAGHGIDITSDVISTPALVPEVVAELPTTGAEGKLYLTPKAHTTSTATGNPIEATITADAGQMESFQLDGDTFQQTYTGKNLCNYTDEAYPVSKNGVVATLDSDSSITVAGTPNANFIIFVSQDITDLLEDGATYTMSSDSYSEDFYIDLVATRIGGGMSYPANTRSGSASFTVNKSTFSKYTINIQTYTTASWGASSKTITRKFQFEKGSTATSWEKFVGGQPSPSPEYPQPIQTVTGLQTVEVQGKNIINATILQDAWSNNDGVSIVYSSQYVRTVEYTPVNASTTYTLSYLVRGSVVMRGNILQYDSNKSFISSTSIANNTTFTTTSTTAFVRFNLYHPDNLAPNDITNLQLELGSTVTDYTPYSKQTYSIDLGDIKLCGLGDDGNGNPLYKDYIYPDGEDWKVHKATATITLDGTEAWIYADNYNYVRCPSYTFVDKPLGGTGLGLQLSNCFGVITDWGTFRDSTGRNAFFPLLDEGYKISIRNTGCSSVENYKSWFATNKPSFYYPVATPTDTIITDTNLIAQLEAIRTATLENGTNTITNSAAGSNLAGDMEIGYYGFNPRNRYDKWLWLDLNNNYEQIGS